MIRPYTIALIYGGKKAHCYAEAMKSLIVEAGTRYPIMPVLIDGVGTGAALPIIDRVEEAFEPVDHAFIFLSDARVISHEDGKELSKSKKATTPNVALELGYLMRKFGKSWEKRIALIADFDYNEYKDNYDFASDIQLGRTMIGIPELAEMKEERSNDDEKKEKYKDLFRDILANVIDDARDHYHLYSSSDTYKPSLEKIFDREEEEDFLSDLSLKKQYQLLLDHWQSEKQEFTRMSNRELRDKYLLLYLFERVLFLLIFKDIKLLNATKDMFMLDISNTDVKILAMKRAYNAIIEYIFGHSGNREETFYYAPMKALQKAMEQTDLTGFEFSFMIIENYLGLCYRQIALKKRDRGEIDTAKEYFAKAQQCHHNVSEQANELYQGAITESIICAYSYFNEARSLDGLDRKKDAIGLMDIAKECRKNLAYDKKIPEIIRRQFQVEYLYAQYVIYKSNKEAGISVQKQVEEALLEIDKLNSTVVADSPLFQKVKEYYDELDESIKPHQPTPSTTTAPRFTIEL